MAVSPALGEAVLVIRMVIFLGLMCFWSYCLREYWKYRDVYPFKNRNNVLLWPTWAICLLQVVNTFQADFFFALGLSCYEDWNCGSLWFFSYIYCVTIPILIVIEIYRAYLVLFRHYIQVAVHEIQVYRQSGELPPGVKSFIQLEKNFYLENRHLLKSDLQKKVCVAFSCVILIVEVCLFHIPAIAGTLYANAFLVSQFISIFLLAIGIMIAFKLHKFTNDNFGITEELKYISIISIIALTVRFGLRDLDWYVVLGCDFLLMYFVMGIAAYFSLWKALTRVDKECGPAGKKPLKSALKGSDQLALRPSKLGHESRLSQAPADGASQSRWNLSLFHEAHCTVFNFKGIVTSHDGYVTFFTFLKSEFSTEYISFWRQAMIVRNAIADKIKSCMLSKYEPDKPAMIRVTDEHNVEVSRIESKSENFQVICLAPMPQKETVLRNACNGRRSDDSLKLAPLDPEFSDRPRPSNKISPIKPMKIDEARPNDSVKKSPISKRTSEDMKRIASKSSLGPPKSMNEEEVLGSFFMDLSDIYDLYIEVDSLNHIDLSEQATARLAAKMTEIGHYVQASPHRAQLNPMSTLSECDEELDFLILCRDLFSEALQETVNVLKHDQFPRFQKHESYFELQETNVKALHAEQAALEKQHHLTSIQLHM